MKSVKLKRVMQRDGWTASLRLFRADLHSLLFVPDCPQIGFTFFTSGASEQQTASDETECFLVGSVRFSLCTSVRLILNDLFFL